MESDAVYIQPIDFSRRDERRLFASVPAQIYAGMAGFVPPLMLDEMMFLNPARNPFLRDNPAQGFIARRCGNIAGRITAQRILAHEDKYMDGRGFFGFTDWADDLDVARALVHSARRWLLTHGMSAMQGGYNFSINHVCGVQSGGFGNSAYIKTPFHAPHVAAHLEMLGFGAVRRMVCAVHDVQNGDFGARYNALAQKWNGNARLQIRPLSRRALHRNRAVIEDIYNDAYAQNWNAIPSSAAESRFIQKVMSPLIYAGWCAIALWDGQQAGMVVQIPNLDEAPRLDAGQISPALIGKVLGRKWRSSRVPLLGVRKSFHGTRAGAMMASALLAHTTNIARQNGVRHIEYGWMLDDNHHILNLVGGLPAQVHKHYTIFEQGL